MVYVLNSSVDASWSATAIAPIVFMCGPPWVPGKTALSSLVGMFSILSSGFFKGLLTTPLLNINDHLGHLRDLWVVVIITWKPSVNGFLSAHQAMSQPIWERSANVTAPTSFAISTNLL